MRKLLVMTAAVAACGWLWCASTLGQGKPLAVGDQAPALTIDQWVQGGPVELSKDASKRFHMVEFWATWCPPCKASIPKLNEIQNKYKDQLNIVSVTVPDSRGNTIDAIKRFVKERGKDMSYVVAVDKGGKTYDSYMEAAGVAGIPHAFLVDKQGRIAWQGSPLDPEMEEIVDGLLQGKYDVDAAKLEAEVTRRFQALNPALQLGKWDVVTQGLRDVLKLDPSNETALDVLMRVYLEQLNDRDSFRGFVDGHIEAHRTNAKVMTNLAVTLCNNEDPTTAMPDLALRAARTAYENASPRGADVTGVYARTLYQIGALDHAITIQGEAVKLAEGDSKDVAQKVLDFYRLCKELQSKVN